jgi:Group II intron, maturase-specific domain
MAIKRFRNRLAREFRALRGANVAAVLAKIVPITRGWAAYYRTVVSSRVFRALDNYLWKLTYKWACWSHSNKPKGWIAGRYFRKFDKFRNDRWVFGDKDTGAYLPRLAWTDIVRHTLVKGGASPDDPALAGYWAQRRQKVKPPLDSRTVRLLSRQDGRCSLCGGKPADPRPATPGLGALVLAGHQKGDHGGLSSPPRYAQCRTRQPNTPRTRHLPPEQTTVPNGGKHRAAADDLNRPSGLLGPRARERACAVLRGPRCSNAPGLPGCWVSYWRRICRRWAGFQTSVRSRNSRRHPPIQRSMIAFIRGVWMLHSTVRIPAAARTESKASVNLLSRSRIINLIRSAGSPRSIIRLRACWAVHSPVGWNVTPRIRTRRVACSITAST